MVLELDPFCKVQLSPRGQFENPGTYEKLPMIIPDPSQTVHKRNGNGVVWCLWFRIPKSFIHAMELNVFESVPTD